uniref:hypothetical protein n=1 Tax=Pseudomonas viridiflava TaxID=33069 RepID=UPI001981786D
GPEGAAGEFMDGNGSVLDVRCAALFWLMEQSGSNFSMCHTRDCSVVFDRIRKTGRNDLFVLGGVVMTLSY